MKDGKYLTAAEKTKILKSFERFVKSGFKETLFTKAVYQHLSLHFGFIAHYNKDGFYQARFGSPQGILNTLNHFHLASPWNFRDENTSGNADLNKAIFDVVMASANEFRRIAETGRIQELREQISAAQGELDNILLRS